MAKSRRLIYATLFDILVLYSGVGDAMGKADPMGAQQADKQKTKGYEPL